jgi:hypothetical protein
MPNATSPTVSVSRARDARGVARVSLFKVDHPRAIDEYIDFFGERSGRRSRRPSSGESLIDSLLRRECA